MIEAISKALYGALTGDSTLNHLTDGRVYNTLAPLHSPLPYVVFSVQGGGMENRTARDSFDMRVVVQGVAENGASAGKIGDAIKATLHNARLTLGAGWSAALCQHDAAFQHVEHESRRQYWYAGGVYRIRAIKE